MKNKNELKEIQKLLMKQMRRLDTAVGKEVSYEINRSGAMSQNAQAFLKSVATSLRVKEMVKNNPKAEQTILDEIGVITND